MLRTELSDEATICSKRLREANEDHRAREAEEREAERREKEAQRIIKDAITSGNAGLAAEVLGNLIDPNDPTIAVRTLLEEGTSGAQQLGVGQSPAMALSAQISDFSLNALGDIQTRALSSLDVASAELDSIGLSDVGGGPGGSSITPPRPPNGFDAISENWEDLTGFAQAAAIASVLYQIAVVLEDDGVASHPSLIDGTFAANITQIAEAVAGGVEVLDEDFYIYDYKAKTDVLEVLDRQAEVQVMVEEADSYWIDNPPKAVRSLEDSIAPSVRQTEKNCYMISLKEPSMKDAAGEVYTTLVVANDCQSNVRCDYLEKDMRYPYMVERGYIIFAGKKMEFTIEKMDKEGLREVFIESFRCTIDQNDYSAWQ